MQSVENLNKVITNELMKNHFDGVQKLQELLVSASEMYQNAISACEQQVGKDKKVILPIEVIKLGNNIVALRSELEKYEINDSKVIRR